MALVVAVADTVTVAVVLRDDVAVVVPVEVADVDADDVTLVVAVLDALVVALLVADVVAELVAVLDALLVAYVEQQQSIGELIAAGHDEALVRRVASLVRRSEYKRRQAPPGPKITPRAFGRDRRYPITAVYGDL